MTTLTASQIIAGYERPAHRDARLGALRVLSARMARAARARAARRELRSLDDHLLRDMGLSRDDIATMNL